MNNIENLFNQIKEIKDAKLINEFLIHLSHNPKQIYLLYLNHFIKNLSNLVLSQVNINIIYLIGEIGKDNLISEKFIDFLIEQYFKSDRWIRNEVLIALEKTSEKNQLSEKVYEVLSQAIHEEYEPLVEKAFILIKNLDQIPENLQASLLRIKFRTQNQELNDLIQDILKMAFNSERQLFIKLSEKKNLEFLDKKYIRTLLTACFESIESVESFRNRILNSNWNEEVKLSFLREIDTFQKILLRKSY